MKTKTLFFSSLVAAAAMSTVPAWAEDKAYTESTTISENLTVDGKISVNNAATVTQSSGTVVSATRLVLNDSSAKKASFYNLEGGVLNILGSNKQTSGGDNDSGLNAILLGHWQNGTSKLTVSGGVLNATDGTTTISWNSGGVLEISGGEANLYGISLNQYRGQAANFTLSSGRLNLGAGGLVTGSNSNKTVALNGGTLGALDNWSSSSTLTIGGNVKVDTTKMSANTEGNANTTSTGATITLSGNITSTTAGSLTVSGAGTLALSGTNTLSGTVSVESGATLNLSGANVTLASAITNSGTVTVNSSTIFVLAESLKSGDDSSTYTLISNNGSGSITNWNSSTLTISNFRQADGSVFSRRSTVDIATVGVVKLNMVSAQTLYWKGGETGTWDLENTINWSANSAATEPNDKFYDLDSVIFDTANANISVSGTVAPTSMTVSQATTLSGTGTVSVAAANLTTSETLTLDSDVTLDLGSSAGEVSKTVSGTGTVKFTSTESGHGGKLTLDKGFTGTIDYTGKFNTNNGTANPNAKFRLSGGSMWGSNTISNDIHFLTDYQIGDSSKTEIVLNGKVTNEEGTTLTVGGTNTTVTFGGETTLGTLKQTAGTLNFSGTGTNTITTLTQTAGTLNFSGTGTNTISSTLYSSTGTLNIGDGTNATAVSATRVEIGDNDGGTSTLNVKQNATLAITGSNNDSGYKSASFLLSEWNNTTTANISGTLLAKDAKLLRGDYATTLNVSGGTLAVKGFYATKNPGNAVTVNVSDSGKLILGSGDVSEINEVNVSLNNGTLAASESAITFSKNIAVTGAGTIDTTKYDFASDGKSISRGTDAAAITLAGAISGSGALTVTGAGTLTLSGANTFSGGVTISAGKVVANNANALGAAAGNVKIAGGQLEISSGITLVQTNITIALSDAYSEKAAILGEGALAEGTTITLTKAEESMIASLVKQTKEYQIFASDTSLANFSVDNFSLDEKAWAGWKISNYDNGKVTLELIPEPSAFGLLAGVGALVFVAARRRRRAK